MKVLKFAITLFLITPTNFGYSNEIIITQTQLNQVALNNLNASDYMLNLAYSRLSKVLDKDRKEMLKFSQRAWIKFRDLEAGFVSSVYEGGSIQPLIHNMALRDITERRVSELTKLYLNETTPQER